MRRKHLFYELGIVIFILFIMLWIFVPKFFGAQNINTPNCIPDPQFRASLHRSYGIDENGILTAQQALNNQKRLELYNCYDFSGLKYFPNITELYVTNDNLGELNFSMLPKLEDLYIGGQNLVSIDTSQNPNLKVLNINLYPTETPTSIPIVDVTLNPKLKTLILNDTYIKSIDLSNCTDLNTFECRNRTVIAVVNEEKVSEDWEIKLDGTEIGLSALDLSHNPKMISLRLMNNHITTLDVSHLSKLRELTCCYSSIAKLNMGSHPVLVNVNCGENNITELDVSGCPGLNNLSCYNNNISKLTFGDHQFLSVIDCRDNLLTKLDVSNLPNLSRLNTENNPIETKIDSTSQ